MDPTLGKVPKDQSYDHLNYGKGATSCNGGLKAGRLTACTVTARDLDAESASVGDANIDNTNIIDATIQNLTVTGTINGLPAPVEFAGIPGQRNVGYVDLVNGDDATGEIGTLNPFQTIQAFIDAVPAGTTVSSIRNVYVAIIAPGDYDEDLTIDITNRKIILTGFGPWSLGTFGGTFWAPSGTPRNITVVGTGAPGPDSIRPGLVISTYLAQPGVTMTTNQSYLSKVRISGDIDFSAATGGSIEVAMTIELFGDLIGGTAIGQSYFYNCRFRGTVSGTNWNLQVSEQCRFQGLVTCTNFSLIRGCQINTGITTAGVPSAAGLRPFGMVNTWWSTGTTFTGPAGSAIMDGFTNYWFKNQPVALAGGATKVITDDVVP